MNNEEIKTPEHLGGHLNRTWIDEGVLKFLVDKYQITSMLDVGCGPGQMLEIGESLGLSCLGIDGDPVFAGKKNIQIHDFTLGPVNANNILLRPKNGWDLAWSVEFLEHVEAKYIDNFMQAFQLCKYAVITHATPGQGGFNHVNERQFNYWQNIFSQYGFKASAIMTQEIREHSSMRGKMADHSYHFDGDEVICEVKKTSFMKKNGWAFKNTKLVKD